MSLLITIILFSLHPVGKPPPSLLLSSAEGLKGRAFAHQRTHLSLSTKNSRYFSAYQKAAFRDGNVQTLNPD